MMNQKKIIAVLIVIAIGITSFSIRGTYAKYKSSVDLTDNTRVAVWNINTTQVVDLFKDSYEIDGVESIDGTKIIAPGTSGKYTFKIAGTAETNYTLEYEAEIEDTVKRLKYYFIEGSDDTDPDNILLEYDDLETLVNEIGKNLFRNGIVYEPGEESEMEYTIRWEWPADEDNQKDSELMKQVIIDPKDPNYQNQPHVRFMIKISAEQKTN
jgi:hypothetical protein